MYSKEEIGVIVEIERKYLVVGSEWREEVSAGIKITQGYIAIDDEKMVRVRICGSTAFLTVKSSGMTLAREEVETTIPSGVAELLLEKFLTGKLVRKIRYKKRLKPDLVVELDEFLSPRKGLILAEIEFPEKELEFTPPNWLGREVTGVPEYYNQVMSTQQ